MAFCFRQLVTFINFSNASQVSSKYYSGSLIQFGIGLSDNIDVCHSAHYICAIFYGTSKAFVYLFLGSPQLYQWQSQLRPITRPFLTVERTHLVWEPFGGRVRRKSPIYLLCIGSMVGHLALFIILITESGALYFSILESRCCSYTGLALMQGSRNMYYDTDGICYITTRKYVAPLVLAFDLYVTLSLLNRKASYYGTDTSTYSSQLSLLSLSGAAERVPTSSFEVWRVVLLSLRQFPSLSLLRISSSSRYCVDERPRGFASVPVCWTSSSMH
jgi:hypothetical protein